VASEEELREYLKKKRLVVYTIERSRDVERKAMFVDNIVKSNPILWSLYWLFERGEKKLGY
jgi:hypothetical protein